MGMVYFIIEEFFRVFVERRISDEWEMFYLMRLAGKFCRCDVLKVFMLRKS